MTEMGDSNQVQAGRNHKRLRRLRLGAALFLLVLVGAGLYWAFFYRNRVFTDNAYVMADSAVVSSRIPATIDRIGVDTDAFVAAGDALVELDPRDYQAVVDKNRAALARIEAEIQQSEVSVQLTGIQTDAQIQAAEAMVQIAQQKEREARHRVEEYEQTRAASEAEFNHARRDFERYSNLLHEGAGSEQQRDRSSTSFKKTKAQFEATDAQIAAARAALAAATQEIDRTKAQLENARADRLRVEMEQQKLAALKARRLEVEAELRTAELNLSYCTIKAPISGYIAQKKIQTGERVQPGQPLLAVVPLQDIYVEANFKETQLENVRLGQPVEVEADIYPGYTYHGKVVGIRAGTGAAFSLLPPENATGNWIKVVQRVPVKVRLDGPPPADHPLPVGVSLGVTVFTKDKSGPRLVIKRSGNHQSKAGAPS